MRFYSTLSSVLFFLHLSSLSISASSVPTSLSLLSARSSFAIVAKDVLTLRPLRLRKRDQPPAGTVPHPAAAEPAGGASNAGPAPEGPSGPHPSPPEDDPRNKGQDEEPQGGASAPGTDHHNTDTGHTTDEPEENGPEVEPLESDDHGPASTNTTMKMHATGRTSASDHNATPAVSTLVAATTSAAAVVATTTPTISTSTPSLVPASKAVRLSGSGGWCVLGGLVGSFAAHLMCGMH